MRYREPIIQNNLTAAEAKDLKERYTKLNPGAQVTIESHIENPRLKTLIALLPLLPSSKMRDQNKGVFMAWSGRRR
jgi:hypothetical protein